MYAITTQLRFFHNNSPGAERFLGTPRFWGIFDLGTDGNLCRQGSDLFLDFCEKQPYSINIITITVIERYERKKLCQHSSIADKEKASKSAFRGERITRPQICSIPMYGKNFPISVLAQYTGTCLFFLN